AEAVDQTILKQLAQTGAEVEVLGATILDAEAGAALLPQDKVWAGDGQAVRVKDGPLTHLLVKTQSIKRDDMTAGEGDVWFGLFRRLLDEFRPDIVFFYGGRALDMLAVAEAKSRGVPSAAYLANGNYKGTRWCRDVDVILTDSEATASFYKEKLGIEVQSIGAFVYFEEVCADKHSRENVLLINPSLAKGAGVALQLALMLEEQRPDIPLEVVESRGAWQPLVQSVLKQLGGDSGSLSNVKVTRHVVDMRPVYGRARLLLAPSLLWESFGRVGVEAMMNGIPAIFTDSGGLPEAVGDAGVKLQLPETFHEPPYTKIPGRKMLQPVVDRIIRFYDDDDHYQAYVQRAYEVARARHDITVSTRRLWNALQPLLAQGAGDFEVRLEARL
ncbi:glycosyltransferase, partial [Rhodosalinus sediminis]